MAETKQYYRSFRLGQQWYGIAIDYVIEVLHVVGLAEMSTTDPDTLGLITLHDAAIPVVDLRRCFGIAQLTFNLSTPILVIHVGQDTTGFIVDEVGKVEEVTDAQPVTYDEPAISHVESLARVSGRLLPLIDIHPIDRYHAPIDTNSAAAASFT